MSNEPISNGNTPSTQPQLKSRSQSQSHQTPYQTTLTALLTHPKPHPFLSPPTSPHKLLLPQTKTTSPSIPTISSLSLHPTIESILHILNADLPSAHFLCRHAEVAPKWESMYVHGILHRVEGDIDNARAWYGNVCETEIFGAVWGKEDKNGDGDGDGDGEELGGGETPEIARLGWKHFLDRIERYRDRSARRRKLRRKSVAGRDASDDKDKEHLDVDGDSVDAETDTDAATTQTATAAERPLTPADQITDWTAEEDALRATSLWEILRVLRYCERKFGTDVVGDARGEFLGRIQSGDLRLQKIAEGMITGGEGWRVF